MGNWKVGCQSRSGSPYVLGHPPMSGREHQENPVVMTPNVTIIMRVGTLLGPMAGEGPWEKDLCSGGWVQTMADDKYITQTELEFIERKVEGKEERQRDSQEEVGRDLESP